MGVLVISAAVTNYHKVRGLEKDLSIIWSCGLGIQAELC